MDISTRRYALSPDMAGYLEPDDVSSCASPNAAGASCDCSVPTAWHAWKPHEHAETGRSGVVLSSDINEPDQQGHNQRYALPVGP